jgi:hypothetical protein
MGLLSAGAQLPTSLLKRNSRRDGERPANHVPFECVTGTRWACLRPTSRIALRDLSTPQSSHVADNHFRVCTPGALCSAPSLHLWLFSLGGSEVAGSLPL